MGTAWVIVSHFFAFRREVTFWVRGAGRYLETEICAGRVEHYRKALNQMEREKEEYCRCNVWIQHHGSFVFRLWIERSRLQRGEYEKIEIGDNLNTFNGEGNQYSKRRLRNPVLFAQLKTRILCGHLHLFSDVLRLASTRRDTRL